MQFSNPQPKTQLSTQLTQLKTAVLQGIRSCVLQSLLETVVRNRSTGDCGNGSGNVVEEKGNDVLVNLKDRRMEMALSQKKLSAMIGVQQPTLSRWESQKQMPSLMAAIRLAHILNTTLDDLTDFPHGPCEMRFMTLAELEDECTREATPAA